MALKLKKMNMINDERELLSKPGDTILETIEYLKMSQAELSERMGKKPSKINDIISGKEPITVNTALQLEMVLGIDAQFWLNREALYRERLARIEQEEFLEQCKEWLQQQPLKELKSLGYIKAEKAGPEMVNECLQFYGVVSPNQWESIYIADYAATNFRKSGAHATALGSMAAWLRIGELELQKIKIPEFSKDNFKKSLEVIKGIAKDHPEDFAIKLREICFEVGVALVYSMSLPKAPISGAARWIGGQPLIQMTDRYKTNDHFWFTFFHEAAHILLHGKKDVFIEEFQGVENDQVKENEANEYSGNMLLPKSATEDLPESITELDIRRLAKQYNTHPGIVVGRLQKLQLVPRTFGTKFKMLVNLDNVMNVK
ncbi:HigA family addiction module antitoxin [Mucilaginibacter sp.]|uniref:HigA family addiction module antitoxin n=1 Tax=Mucilaginibacter sp. TaxID=1882438 RepID=UPI002604D303|nr:HigA family addiction module antitoxin [Mucilaginibacter sp.]